MDITIRFADIGKKCPLCNVGNIVEIPKYRRVDYGCDSCKKLFDLAPTYDQQKKVIAEILIERENLHQSSQPKVDQKRPVKLEVVDAMTEELDNLLSFINDMIRRGWDKTPQERNDIIVCLNKFNEINKNRFNLTLTPIQR